MTPSAAIEALLFVADQPVSRRRLAEALGWTEDAVTVALDALDAELMGRGLRLQWHGELVQLATAPEHALAIESFLGLDSTVRLSTAALETLAVVAYRQPATRAQMPRWTSWPRRHRCAISRIPCCITQRSASCTRREAIRCKPRLLTTQPRRRPAMTRSQFSFAIAPATAGPSEL